ncbi:MAG: glycosyltransferase [Lawsonibacter sp.]
MRVLFTASTTSHICNFHLPYLRAFRAMGWTVAVACGGDPSGIVEADERLALPFEKRMTALANWKAQRMLQQFLEEHPCDLVCTHTSLAAFFTRRATAGLRHRPPVVNVAHGYLFDDQTSSFKRQILLGAERLTARQTDLVLTMNRYDLEVAKRYHLGSRVENIPGIGVDFTRLDGLAEFDREKLRANYGFEAEDFVLVYAAEFSVRKNQSMLIRSLAALPKQVKLLLPGQGALWDTCRDLAVSLGLESRVIFPGQVSNMAALYALSDGAVSASRSEGLPFNVMESMYAGLPVIASAVKGHVDLIVPGQTGLLYPYGDEKAFVAAVTRLLEEAGLAQALGANARRWVTPYSLAQVLPQVMDWYMSALSVPAEENAAV